MLKALERVLRRKSKRVEPSRSYTRAPDDSARRIHASMLMTKWADVEYYGPGAEEAEARRRETLGLAPKEEGKKKEDDSVAEVIAFFKTDLRQRR